jgi:hypothetical protein
MRSTSQSILLTLLFAFLSTFSNIQAQDIIVANSVIVQDNRKLPAKEVTVSGKPDEALESMRNTLSKSYKAKSKVRKGTLEAKEVLLKGLIDKKGDLTVVADAVGDNSLVRASFALGYDIFVSEENYTEDYAQLGKLMNIFAMQHQLNRLETFIKLQKKELKSKNKILSAEQSALKTYDRQLKTLKKTDNADKMQLELTEQKINTSKGLIDVQKSAVEEIQNNISKMESQVKQIKSKL